MMSSGLQLLGAEGLRRFQALRADAVSAVTDRFYATYGAAYEQFGPRGRDACREDLAFHLEFLAPVLEFGLLQPMVHYLCWFANVLAVRGIPTDPVVQSLDWLGEFLAGRMDAADAAVVTAALGAARTGFLEATGAPGPMPQQLDSWPEVAGFEAALLAGDQRQASVILNRCLDAGHGLVDVELHVIQPALYRIGEAWQANRVTVAMEHLATAIAQSVMTMGLLRSTLPEPINRRVLLACVEGNNHTVGLRMVADAFQLASWEVQYLGASVPTEALVHQVLAWRPSLVGLSVSFAHQLRGVKAVIVQLDQRLGSARPPVMVGGLAINRFNQMAGLVGADGSSTNAHAAVVNARQLVHA